MGQKADKKRAEEKARAAKNAAKKAAQSTGTSKYGSLVDSISSNILKSKPKEKKTVKDFEKVYGKKLQAEDLAQSEALFKPYYDEKINTILEDLNTTIQLESVDYTRALRRARSSMALGGGAIGTERDQVEGEMTQDSEARKKSKIQTAERMVGTDRLTAGGFVSAGTSREGELVGEMKKNIADQQLWYKNQRAERYYRDAGAYYSA